ncbi:hypothetical protein ACB092_11G221700 [Castanea dentata]
MFPMVTRVMDYGQQVVGVARYISQEKFITSEFFCSQIHFEFDKYIACEVCVHACPIDLLVDWELETNI